MKLLIIAAAALAAAPGNRVQAQFLPAPGIQSFQAADGQKKDSDYQRGLDALDARNWDTAIRLLRESASRRDANADAALYWTAYAQSHAGEREEALTTIRQLQQAYASSRWVNDAKALELEIRGEQGNPVSAAAEPDLELKLLALNSLMASDPEKAMPALKKLLAGNSSDKLKERALFVLVQNPTPEARKMIGDMARGTSDPALQLKAIRYMGMMGGQASRADLVSLYGVAKEDRVKRAILQSFMMSGSRSQLAEVAKTETNPGLRREAIRQLAISGGKDELWQLFQTESSIDNKEEILHSMFLTGDSTRLADAARTLKDKRLKLSAIKSLGLMGSNGQSDALVSIYRSDSDPAVRRAVLQALFLQQNGKALVDLARAEKDPEMKREIVKQMSLVHSPEVTDYMMEVLK